MVHTATVVLTPYGSERLQVTQMFLVICSRFHLGIDKPSIKDKITAVQRGNTQLRDGAIPIGLLRLLDELPRRAAKTRRFRSSPCISSLLRPFETQTIPGLVFNCCSQNP